MGDFFSSFASDQNRYDWFPTIISSLFGPFGHLYLRIAYLNGSLDKLWLFLPGSIPPISLLANIAMKRGYVERGKGDDVIDRWVLVPIIFKFAMALLLYITGNTEGLILHIMILILQMETIMVPNIIRAYNNCEKNVSTDSIIKAATDSYITYGFSSLLPLLFKVIPFLRPINRITHHIPGFHDVLWSLGFVFVYIIINMVNQDNMTTYCKDPIGNKITLFITLIISTALMFFDRPTSHISNMIHNKVAEVTENIIDNTDDTGDNTGDNTGDSE